MYILYGVNGEGMGHAMRSAEIIKGLKETNELKIITGGRASDYLKKFGNLRKVSHLSFVSRNGKINYLMTAILNLVKLPIFLYHFLTNFFMCIIKRPKIIITDFEPLTAYLGLALRIPVLSFDNQHIVTDTEIPPIKGISSKLLYKIVVYLMIPFPRKKIITTFFYPKIIKKNTIFTKPVVREVIIKQKSKSSSYFLIYLSLKNDKLLEKLKKLNVNCIVYGKTNLKSSKYMKIKKFDEKQFAYDLANARAVISNAGMTTLTESIYLKKPILCIPIEDQVEQELNAYYIEKKGYGLSREKIDQNTIKKFLTNLEFYKKNLKKN